MFRRSIYPDSENQFLFSIFSGTVQKSIFIFDFFINSFFFIFPSNQNPSFPVQLFKNYLFIFPIMIYFSVIPLYFFFRRLLLFRYSYNIQVQRFRHSTVILICNMHNITAFYNIVNYYSFIHI